MKFSTKTRYGIRTMLEIALNKFHGGVFQKDISANQEISLKYLDQIIPALKTAGLIANVKGKKSGYTLTCEPSKITMYDIHRAFESDICIVICLEKNVICSREPGCALRIIWNKLNIMIINYMKSITLEDIINMHISLS